MILASGDYEDGYMEDVLFFTVSADGTASVMVNFTIGAYTEEGIDAAEDLMVEIVKTMYIA